MQSVPSKPTPTPANGMFAPAVMLPPTARIPQPGYYPPVPQPPPQPPQVKPDVCTPPVWLKELLEYRTAKKRVILPLKADVTTIKQSEDALCAALLKAIEMMNHDGPVKTKLKISKVGPPSALKDLLSTINDLALSCFENLPPSLACVRASDIAGVTTANESTIDVPISEPNSYSSIHDYMDAMGMNACAMPGSDPSLASHMIPHDYYGWSEPPRMSMPATPSLMPSGLPPLNGSHLFQPMNPNGEMIVEPMMQNPLPPSGSAPPADGMWQHGNDVWLQNTPMYQPPSFMPFPYGLPYHRLNEARRKCGFDSADLFPTTKKGPSVGDRPLTPPAQGWYAKYSSGVTGVVWDRVHQAWVVSWTLAGKRTFRHFTCKSYGGFDKAREAAIEFRLARNREIAAYNKRCKDKK